MQYKTETLGDYEKRVLLDLSNSLSIVNASVLIAHLNAEDLFSVISNCYDRSRTVNDCTTAILNIRLTLLQECPCAMCKQSKLCNTIQVATAYVTKQ